MNNIYITGFMSSGKTVVSKKLAELLNRKLFDTDKIIENKLGMKIKDIFEKYGEEYFREVESDVLKELSEQNGVVVSTGGGIVIRDENRSVMKSTGKIIALMPEFSVIEKRLSTARKTRPLLMEETDKIRKRFNARVPLYKECDFEIVPGQKSSVDETAKHIFRLLKGEI